ncbi:uncharacterized protein LOC144910364 [Branchiostoma floridae x Branchiostoma belcheri]
MATAAVESSSNLTAQVELWTIDDVSQWLQQNDLAEFVDLFQHEQIDGKSILAITETSLMMKTTGSPISNRRKLINAIETLKNDYTYQSSDAECKGTVNKTQQQISMTDSQNPEETDLIYEIPATESEDCTYDCPNAVADHVKSESTSVLQPDSSTDIYGSTDVTMKGPPMPPGQPAPGRSRMPPPPPRPRAPPGSLVRPPNPPPLPSSTSASAIGNTQMGDSKKNYYEFNGTRKPIPAPRLQIMDHSTAIAQRESIYSTDSRDNEKEDDYEDVDTYFDVIQNITVQIVNCENVQIGRGNILNQRKVLQQLGEEDFEGYEPTVINDDVAYDVQEDNEADKEVYEGLEAARLRQNTSNEGRKTTYIVIGIVDCPSKGEGNIEVKKNELYLVDITNCPVPGDDGDKILVHNKQGIKGYIDLKNVRTHGSPEDERWFFPLAISSRCATILLESVNHEGCFLVRKTCSDDRRITFVLSVWHDGSAYHYPIREDTAKNVRISRQRTFFTVGRLIEFYKRDRGVLRTRLTFGVKELLSPSHDNEPSEQQLSLDRSKLQLKDVFLHGMFGTISKAESAGKPVSVKILQSTDDRGSCCRKEANMMLKCQHPNVVEVHGFTADGATPQYLVLEPTDVGTLHDYITEYGDIETKAMLEILFQISSALDHLGSLKYVLHRDVQTRACLVCTNGAFKLSGFHLARRVIDNSYKACLDEALPVRWLAPEVLSKLQHSTKSDIWAFGVLAWELFSGGTLPYTEGNVQTSHREVINSVLEGARLPRPPNCPIQVYKVLRACWRRAKAKRPNFFDLTHLLEKIRKKDFSAEDFVSSQQDEQDGADANTDDDEDDQPYGYHGLFPQEHGPGGYQEYLKVDWDSFDNWKPPAERPSLSHEEDARPTDVISAQEYLITLQKDFKAGKMTIEEVESKFKTWSMQHGKEKKKFDKNKQSSGKKDKRRTMFQKATGTGKRINKMTISGPIISTDQSKSRKVRETGKKDDNLTEVPPDVPPRRVHHGIPVQPVQASPPTQRPAKKKASPAESTKDHFEVAEVIKILAEEAKRCKDGKLQKTSKTRPFGTREEYCSVDYEMMEGLNCVRVKHKYRAKHADELTIHEGDLVIVKNKETRDKGWWQGELGGKIGLFPDNFVEDVPAVKKQGRPLQEDDPSAVVSTTKMEGEEESGGLPAKKNEVFIVDNTDNWDEQSFLAYSAVGKRGGLPKRSVKPYGSIEGERWYFPELFSKDARLFLQNEGEEGCFVIHRSGKQEFPYTLSLCHRREVMHYHIENDEFGNFLVDLEVEHQAEGRRFFTLHDLIKYYQHNRGVLVTKLRRPLCDGGRPITPGLDYDQKWEIEEENLSRGNRLGAGHYGVVYEGTCCVGRDMKINVAIKVMRGAGEGSSLSEKLNFIEEAQILMKVNHPNILKLIGVRSKKHMVMVTELMTQGNLKDYLRAEHTLLDKPVLIYMLSQVLSAMKYLEGCKYILHRDVSARNCLVGDNYTVKIADFGKARFVLDDSYKAARGESLPFRWLAPEVIVSNIHTTKADVWAFGVLMWEVFTGGERPYKDIKENKDVAAHVAKGNCLDMPRACPEGLCKIMRLCWIEDPTQRPSFLVLDSMVSDLRKNHFPYCPETSPIYQGVMV